MRASRAEIFRRPKIFNGTVVTAGFTTRHGGRSGGPFASLNLGLSTGDNPQDVASNRRTLFEAAGLDAALLAVAGQVHGVEVQNVDKPGLYAGRDALVTTEANLILAITAADCAVVLLADERASVVAAVHSGWRGTASAITSLAISEMQTFGASVPDIRAYVSPCISVNNFEVGEEVAAQFEERYVVRRPEWPRPHVDLQAAIVDQILDAGVDRNQLETADECTFNHPDFYSYRASGGTTGRMMGFIALRTAP